MNPVRPERSPGYSAHPIELGARQPQFRPLPAFIEADGRVTTDWEPNGEELSVLRAGGRVRLTTLTFGNPFQPVILGAIPSSKDCVDHPAIDPQEIEDDARVLCDSYNGESGTYDNLRPEALRRHWRDAAVAVYRARVVRARL